MSYRNKTNMILVQKETCRQMKKNRRSEHEYWYLTKKQKHNSGEMAVSSKYDSVKLGVYIQKNYIIPVSNILHKNLDTNGSKISIWSLKH